MSTGTGSSNNGQPFSPDSALAGLQSRVVKRKYRRLDKLAWQQLRQVMRLPPPSGTASKLDCFCCGYAYQKLCALLPQIWCWPRQRETRFVIELLIDLENRVELLSPEPLRRKLRDELRQCVKDFEDSMKEEWYSEQLFQIRSAMKIGSCEFGSVVNTHCYNMPFVQTQSWNGFVDALTADEGKLIEAGQAVAEGIFPSDAYLFLRSNGVGSGLNYVIPGKILPVQSWSQRVSNALQTAGLECEDISEVLLRLQRTIDDWITEGRPVVDLVKQKKLLRDKLELLNSAWHLLAVPQWDSDKGELYFNNRIARTVAKQAKTLRDVLDVFQTAHWPWKVPSPFYVHTELHGKQPTNEAIRQLNRAQTGLRFSREGKNIVWQPMPRLPSESRSAQKARRAKQR